MMKGSSSLTDEAIERIVELSADAQIERRRIAKDCMAFRQLTGAITAYGKAIGILVAVREQEELWDILCTVSLLESAGEQIH